MALVSRTIGRLVLAGLSLILLSSTAKDAKAQASWTGDRPAVTSSGAYPGAHRPSGYAPKTVKLASRSQDGEPNEIVEGGTYYEDSNGQLVLGTPPIPGKAARAPLPRARRVETPMEDVFTGDAFAEDDSCADSCLVPCCGLPLLSFENLELFAGVQGFTGPANTTVNNRGSSGSFGFHEGLNWGAPFPLFQSCLGMQLGAQVVHSNLSGAEFTTDTRTQLFATGGLFRRVDVGLQGGVVVDYMHDNWYREISMINLRSEVSWVCQGQDDFGFWFTKSIRDSGLKPSTLRNADGTVDPVPVLEGWRPTDLYAFFYRRQFGECRDGEARIFGGFSGQSDGLVGIDGRLPLSDCWALQAGFTYLIPKEGTGIGITAAHAQESWNLGMSLVWVPGRPFGQSDSRYYRPLINVADNGTFMVDRRP